MQIALCEKIVLCILMALGLFASSVVLIRAITFHHYVRGVRGGDKLWYMVDITTWNLLEGEIGIIVACIPYLKALFERVSRRLGILKKDRGVYGATSIRISGYDYDSEIAAHKRRMKAKGDKNDEIDLSVTETTSQSDTRDKVKGQDSITPGETDKT